MKTISKLFMPVLFLFGTALLAGCEDSKPPIDESEPENPTLFEYVLTVVDDTTGQPRAEESVTIKRTNKAGDVVHSSTDYTTDADGVITMNVRSGYYVAEAAFEPGGKKDVIHKFEIANHLLKSTMHLKDPNPDIYPHQSVITVRNAKTGSWPKSCRGMRASILLRPTPPPSANSSGPALKIRSTSPSAIRKAT